MSSELLQTLVRIAKTYDRDDGVSEVQQQQHNMKWAGDGDASVEAWFVHSY